MVLAFVPLCYRKCLTLSIYWNVLRDYVEDVAIQTLTELA